MGEAIKSINIKHSWFLFAIFFVIININLFAQNGNITLTSPTGNEVYKSGSELVVTWTSINIDKIKLEYSIDDGNTWREIVSNLTAHPSYFIWKVPNFEYQKVFIRITDVVNPSLFYINSQPFIIRSQVKANQKSFRNTSKVSGAAVRIMPLGNSITEGVVGSSNETGYRRTLDSLLNAHLYNFDFVGSQQDGIPNDFDKDNEGHGGWHAHHLNFSWLSIDDSVYSWLTKNTPDYILLHIGTNDLGELTAFSQDPNQTSLQQVNDVSSILDSIDKFESDNAVVIPVFLARIINRTDDATTTTVNETDTTTAFNLELQQMADNRIAMGDKIIVLNQEAALQYPDDLSDGIHPNDNGYNKMAYKWFTTLNSYFQNCPDNMISYWQMNEKGTFSTISDKLNINDGNCSGSTCPADTTGMNNGALYFDGIDDKVLIPDNYSLNFGNALNFTVETWIKTSQTGTGNKVFLGKYNPGSTSWWLGMNVNDGFARFSFRSSANDIYEVAGTSNIIDGNWHHIVGVKNFDTGEMKIYVDGILENTISATFNGDFSGTNPLSFGCYDNQYYYNGKLDETAIYDRALGSSEIQQQYNNGIIGKGYCNENNLLADIKIFLEGPYLSGNQMSADLKNNGALPLTQPYDQAPYFFSGAERVTSIPNSTSAIVDWVLIELRSDLSAASGVKKRAAFVRADGKIVDLDGVSKVSFSGVPNGNYYIVVYHRNHLPVMSASAVQLPN